MNIRVAGYQMAVSSEVERNVEKIIAAIDSAAAKEADILLTPEGSLSGYTHEFEPASVEKALEYVTGHARDAGIGLALGTCFVEQDGNCYNQIRFYGIEGDFLGFHSKTLCCGTLDQPSTGEINHYSVAGLRVFPWQTGVTIGGLICNDMWANPGCTPMPDTHLSQQLSGKGARMIFHAVNGGRNGSEWSSLVWNYHESNLRMRAKTGKLWVITVDNAHPEDLPCSSPSGVIDPEGNWVCRASATGEDLFVHTIAMDQSAT